jgi:hypothetical protein
MASSVFRPMFPEDEPMLYWLGAYSLVIIAVFVPFTLLYIVGSLVWLGLAAIRFTIRNIKNVLTLRTNFFSREHSSMILPANRYRFQRSGL